MKVNQSTIDELLSTVSFLKKEVGRLNLRVEELEKENRFLKAELAKYRTPKNSSNSSIPPSKDEYGPKRNQSLRKKSGKKQGGQAGHKGTTKLQVPNVDQIVECTPIRCSGCTQPLAGFAQQVVGKRQQIDIPPILPKVTEYRQMMVKCSCGCSNKGVFPDSIKSPVQLGPTITSFLVYLNVAQLIPFKRLQSLCADLFNFSLCKRSIENSLDRVYQKAVPLHKQIMEIIKSGPWVGADETGTRVEAKRWWQWVWQNMKATYYTVHPGRGYKVVRENFSEDYQGILVHDCWSAHNNTYANNGHQLCHAHLLRDLQYLIEKHRSSWAYDFQQFLLATQRAREHIYKPGFTGKKRRAILQFYDNKLIEFIAEDQSVKEVFTFQKRIRKHKNAILLFFHYPDVPFHNNSAEQAIRMAKVKQKISGGFRSVHGAIRHAVLLSIIETAKKQKINILTAINKLMANDLNFSA